MQFFFNSNFKVFRQPFNRAGRRVENRVVSCLWLQTGRNIWWITARSRSYSPHYWQSNSPTLWSNQWFNRCDGVSWCSDQSQVCDWMFRRIFICVYISGQTGTWSELYDLYDLYVFNNICTLCGILSCMTDSWLQIWPHVNQILISLSQNLIQLLYMVLSTLYEMYRKCKFPCMCRLAFIQYTLILVINASAEVLSGCNSMILEMTRLKFDFHVQARVYDPHFVKGSSLTQSRFSLIIREFILSLQFKWKHKHLQNNFKL